MTHRKDVVTFADIMENLDQIPKGDPFARGRGPVDPLRERSLADALSASQLAERVRELEERLSDTEDRRYRLTQELDEAFADYQDLGRVMHEECARLEAECERMKTFAAKSFSQMMCQEVEQMREYGLSYEGVRKVLREHDDGEISFGKLMDLIRAAARAMAEDMKK